MRQKKEILRVGRAERGGESLLKGVEEQLGVRERRHEAGVQVRRRHEEEEEEEQFAQLSLMLSNWTAGHYQEQAGSCQTH